MEEEPKYKTLAELVTAIKNNEVPEDAVLTIDNDSVKMYFWTEDEDGDLESHGLLFDGDIPAILLEEALTLLGIPWENA